RQGSSLTTSPLAAITSHARLVALGCVDSVQPDSLAMDLQRIAVDDGGDANDPGGILRCARDPLKASEKQNHSRRDAQEILHQGSRALATMVHFAYRIQVARGRLLWRLSRARKSSGQRLF